MTLYHAEIRLPEGCHLPQHRVNLAWTHHARKAAHEDRYGDIPIFTTLPLSQFNVIEVETDHNGEVVKWLLRGRFDAERDVVFALIPEHFDTWTVKTVWYNLRSDAHQTLDRSRYAR